MDKNYGEQKVKLEGAPAGYKIRGKGLYRKPGKEERIRIGLEAARLGVASTARKYGADLRAVRRYKAEAGAPALPGGSPRVYPEETRVMVAVAVLKERSSIAGASRRFGVDRTSVRRFVRWYQDTGHKKNLKEKA